MPQNPPIYVAGMHEFIWKIIDTTQVEAMLGKFSLDTMMRHGGMPAALFLIIYLFTMIVMIMNFFVAILNDFLAAVANDEKLQNRDFEVMDHFLETVKELFIIRTLDHGSV